LLAARAEKAVLRMIAAESAIFVTLDISYLLGLFAAGATAAHPIRSTKGRVIPGVAKFGVSLRVTFHHQLVRTAAGLHGLDIIESETPYDFAIVARVSPVPRRLTASLR
jgi:hypothetical protein